MNNQEAIETLKANYPDACYEQLREAVDMAISALQEQDSRRICNTCKHDPPSKRWPCVDCDMRESADRWEPKEVNNLTESSLTYKALDTISRTAVLDLIADYDLSMGQVVRGIHALPSAQPEPDWTEIMVVCDNCGHIIHVKRVNVLPLGRAEGR